MFLIRDPAEVVASYLKSRASVTPDDIGLLQQGALFDELVARSGRAAAGDRRRRISCGRPKRYLRALCERLGIAFTERMLQWPAGPRDSDGVWAPHWYDAVWKSTGFERWRPRDVVSWTTRLASVAEACRPAYERLHGHRLRRHRP